MAYFNLKAAIENRLALLKERAARMAAPKPYEESQLSYKQEGNIEYLDVNLGGGMVVKLKRVDGDEWIVSGSKAPPEMYNTGKPMPKWPRNEEVLGRLPERYRRGKGKVEQGEGVGGKIISTFETVEIATKAITESRLPIEFIDALKSTGKSEDEILEYFTNYHNNRSGQRFFNNIENFITNNNTYNLTRGEVFAIWGYTTNLFYKDLNAWLRNGENILQTTDLTNLINGGLSKLPTFSGQSVFRGISINIEKLQDFLNNYKLGVNHRWDDFTSCGGTKLASFGGRPDVNIIFEIRHKAGKDISDLADGIQYGNMPRPEILIKSNSIFEVISGPTFNATSGKWEIILIQIQ